MLDAAGSRCCHRISACLCAAGTRDMVAPTRKAMVSEGPRAALAPTLVNIALFPQQLVPMAQRPVQYLCDVWIMQTGRVS